MKSGTATQIGYSVLAQLVRYGAPLLFYPLLVRILGTNGFASFVVAMAVGQTVGQFTEFGFGLSAVRELADKSQRRTAASLAVGQVLFGKLCMLAISTIVVTIAIYLTKSANGFLDYLLPLSIGAAYGFTPNWYYIGLGRAKRLAVYEILVSTAQLGLIVAFVRSNSDVVLATICVIAPVIVLAIYGQVAVIRELSIQIPNFRQLVEAVVTSFHFFVSTNFASLSNKILLILLSTNADNTQIAYYAAAERIATAGLNTLMPISRVLVPRVTTLFTQSREAAEAMFRKAFLFTFVFYSGVAVVLAAASPWLVPLAFGNEMTGATASVALFMFVIPIAACGRIVGLLSLVPARLESLYQRVTLIATGLGLLISIPVTALGESVWVVLVRLFIEAVITAGCFYIMRMKRGVSLSLW